MQTGIARVDIAYELPETSLGMIAVSLVGALICAGDEQSLVEIGKLFKALVEHFERKLHSFEYLFVREETDRRPMPFSISDLIYMGDSDPAFVALAPTLAVASDGDLHP